MGMTCMFVATTDDALEALFDDPDTIEDFLDASDDGRRELDIDKAWHGLHFLLTGEAWGGEPPLDFVVSGGEPIGEVDVGYGPARGFDNEDLRAIADALAPITVEKLFERWDRAAIVEADLYVVDPDDRDEAVDWLGSTFTDVKAFVTAAARDGLGMIVYMT